MRWYVGYPILIAGLAFGFETVFPSEPGFNRTNPADFQAHAFTSQAKEPTVVMASEIGALPQSRLADFSPGSRLSDADPSSGRSVLDYLAQALTPTPPAPEPVTLQPVTVSVWKSVVVRDKPSARATPAAEDARVALTRDIQRELQRVGCYVGEIDGVWGGGSKRAIFMFLDRVNASLPSRDPDVIMLSLVRGQGDSVCSATCPHGQSLTAAGQCVPTTLLVQADRDRGRTSEPPVPSAVDVAWADTRERGPELEGRMSIGGPRPTDVVQLTAGWSQTIVEPPREPARDRTAALLEAESRGDSGLDRVPAASVASSSFDGAVGAPSVKRSKPTGSRSKSSRTRPAGNSAARHVQRLFTNPLGRM